MLSEQLYSMLGSVNKLKHFQKMNFKVGNLYFCYVSVFLFVFNKKKVFFKTYLYSVVGVLFS